MTDFPAPTLSPTFPIGAWVRRERNGTAVTREHLCESLVADDAVTRCGRRMRDTPGTSLRYELVPERACVVCGPKRADGGPVLPAPEEGYWVAESGPEWFVPAKDGFILPLEADKR